MRAATPPIVPPTIAPAGVELPLDAAAASDVAVVPDELTGREEATDAELVAIA